MKKLFFLRQAFLLIYGTETEAPILIDTGGMIYDFLL
jgi:hypothetical protein